MNNGEGRVLGIFASKRIPSNRIQKRDVEVTTDGTTTNSPVATTTGIPPTEEPLKDDYTYNAEGKCSFFFVFLLEIILFYCVS